MKCWWAATILLIGLLVGTSSADWVILKVDIKKPVEVDSKSGTGAVQPNPTNPKDKKGSPAPEQPPGSFIYLPIEVKKFPHEDEQYRFFELEPVGVKNNNYRLPSHQVVIDKFITIPTVLERFNKKYAEAKKNKTPENLIKVAKWALEHGLISDKIPVKGPTDKFHWTLEKLREEDPKHPMLATLDKVKEEFFKNPPTTDDPRLSKHGADGSPSLLEHFKKYRPYSSHHYTVFTNLPDSTFVVNGINHRLERLEQTYLSFFYWFALQGQPLPMPKYRLGVILTNTNTQEERSKAKKILEDFNPGPLVVNGFNARRDNLMVLPSMRIDPLFQKFSFDNSQAWGGKDVKMTFDQMIDPTKEQREKLRKIVQFDQRKCFYLAAHQARALAQRHMENEAEWANITHDCAQQLCIATNLVPRNVAAPEWIQYGLGSFFETPPPAFHRTMASPNWTECIHFRFLFQNELDNQDTDTNQLKDILLNVVKDRYFRQALRTAQNLAGIKAGDLVLPDELLKSLEDKNRKHTRLARSTAWALTYYLAKNKLPLLLRYSEELNRLPRDMEFDEATLMKCFTDALQGESVADLAKNWFQYMRGVNLGQFSPFQELMLSDLRAESAAPMTKTKDDADTKN